MVEKNQNQLLVEVEDLKTYFYLHEGTVKAVDGVSFELFKGKTLGVIGESGCGKSVTARSIMQLVASPPGKIINGSIKIHHYDEEGKQKNEIDILKLKPDGKEMRKIRWKDIAIIFQEPMTSMSPVHTVFDQINEAIRLHLPEVSKQESRERTIELIRRVGIPQPDVMVDAYSYQLSGGMRQRAMIAMALSCNPALLIADEPTTALDVTVESQILELIREIQDEYNMGIMYISHDLAVVAEMSDDIMVMYLGQAVEKTDVNTIFDRPMHPYTQALWRSIPTIDGDIDRLEPIQGTIPSPYYKHTGCRFYERCEQRIEGVCNSTFPELIEVNPGHFVRCLLYK
ncbi:MAG: ABC transporter ATP-binding protein [Anaerolineaceae bacterium]|nr:ABC transporter ATP-binding protein [Anaerolineaceae bacterium]